jgi:hypothetical protein
MFILAIRQYLREGSGQGLGCKNCLFAPIRAAFPRAGCVDVGKIAGDQVHSKSLGAKRCRTGIDCVKKIH